MAGDERRLPDDKEAGDLLKDPQAAGGGNGSEKPRNPIDQDLHKDEPRAYGPDGSGETPATEHKQPYRGAD